MPVLDWWIQGAKRLMLGLQGLSSSGYADKRLRAKIVPALWLARETRSILRWFSKAGIISRKVEMRWFRGTDVEPPNPGLRNSWSAWGLRIVEVAIRAKTKRGILSMGWSRQGQEFHIPIHAKNSYTYPLCQVIHIYCFCEERRVSFTFPKKVLGIQQWFRSRKTYLETRMRTPRISWTFGNTLGYLRRNQREALVTYCIGSQTYPHTTKSLAHLPRSAHQRLHV